MEILHKLGIDWKLLLAQAVNFAILFWVLKRFAYRPMLEFLESRAGRIEQGLRDAEAAKERLVAVSEEGEQILRQAREEARELVRKAEDDAKGRAAKRAADTEAQVAKLLSDARTEMAEERQKTLQEAKGEIAGLVTLAVEKVLKEKVDAKKDQDLIAEALR